MTDECLISETALDCCSPESFSCLVAPLCFFLITSRSSTKARLPVGVRPLGAERLREKKKSFGTQLVIPFVWSRWSRKHRGVDNEVMFVLLRDEKFEHKAQVKVNPNPHFFDYFYSTIVDNMDSCSSKGCSPDINSYKCVKNWATYYFSISSIKTDLCSYICVCAWSALCELASYQREHDLHVIINCSIFIKTWNLLPNSLEEKKSSHIFGGTDMFTQKRTS